MSISCNNPAFLNCGGGYRSALAADMLQKMGYTNARVNGRRLVGLARPPTERWNNVAERAFFACGEQ